MAKKHHTKIIMATVFGVFFLTVGLATGAYLSTQSQDTRNQAWGGNGWQEWDWHQGGKPPRPSITIPQKPSIPPLLSDVPNGRNIRDGRFGVNPQNYEQYLTGRNCDYTTYNNRCQGNTLVACTPSGKEVRANCTDFDATCGLAPVGRNAGKAVCIPNNLGSQTLPNGMTLQEAYQKYYSGTCNQIGQTSCSGQIMTACLPGGKKVSIPCADVGEGASCGTIPAGPNAGKAACIPTDLPEIPAGGVRGGIRNGNGEWPNVTYPSIQVPTKIPFYNR